MKLIMALFFSATIALFLFVSNHNSKTPEPKGLYGKYSFNISNLDSIVIFSNHTYKHKYVNSSGKTYANIGTWKWNINEIEFHDFSFYNDEGPSGVSGLWISKVEESADRVRLIYSSDDNSCYLKLTDSKK
jgi:hypothetical protein